jgi:hypothetical protein
MIAQREIAEQADQTRLLDTPCLGQRIGATVPSRAPARNPSTPHHPQNSLRAEAAVPGARSIDLGAGAWGPGPSRSAQRHEMPAENHPASGASGATFAGRLELFHMGHAALGKRPCASSSTLSQRAEQRGARLSSSSCAPH